MRIPAALAACALLPAALAGPAGQEPPPPPATRPSVVLIVADDLGWGDLACTGSRLQDSPRLDRLAGEGARFTDAYAAAPNCSPGRAALLTGRAPARLGLTTFLNEIELPYVRLREPQQPRGLPLEERTLAELLRAQGYATGFVGKWHLGDDGFLPEAQGFDVALRGRELRREYGPRADELTEHEASAAIRFVEEHAEGPFFLYLALHAVHPPTAPTPEQRAKYAARLGAEGAADAAPAGRGGDGDEDEEPADRAAHAALVEQVDTAVGRLLDALERLGLAGTTCVVFTSDNGASEGRGDNGPFRGGKDLLTEGGLRVPLLARGPGVEPGAVLATPVIGTDLVPTVLALAGLEPPGDLVLDGESLAPLLSGGELPERDLFWHFPHYSRSDAGGVPSGAVRSGRFKLVETFEDGGARLYDLAADPGELTDVTPAHRELARDLRERLARWRAQVGAALPEPNPGWDPRRPDRRVVPEKVRRKNERHREHGEDG